MSSSSPERIMGSAWLACPIHPPKTCALPEHRQPQDRISNDAKKLARILSVEQHNTTGGEKGCVTRWFKLWKSTRAGAQYYLRPDHNWVGHAILQRLFNEIVSALLHFLSHSQAYFRKYFLAPHIALEGTFQGNHLPLNWPQMFWSELKYVENGQLATWLH